jgi:hypothetical protein
LDCYSHNRIDDYLHVLCRRLSLSVSRKVFFAWFMMALGALCFTLGDAFWAYIETVQNLNPFVSIADIPNLLPYLFL